MTGLIHHLPDLLPWFALGGLLDLFSKKTTQTSNTTNVDNTRNTALTDSLNQWISQNQSITRADSRVFNSAFDATNSFNTVQNYQVYDGGVPAIPTLDFTGLRSLFSTPDELSALLGTPALPKDPNANKYDWNFTETSAGGNQFLAGVQDLVRSSWQGIADASKANQPGLGATGWLLVILAAGVAGWLILKGLKR